MFRKLTSYVNFSCYEVFCTFLPENVFDYFYCLCMESQPFQKKFHTFSTVILSSLKLTTITCHNVFNTLQSNVCIDALVSVAHKYFKLQQSIYAQEYTNFTYNYNITWQRAGPLVTKR